MLRASFCRTFRTHDFQFSNPDSRFQTRLRPLPLPVSHISIVPLVALIYFVLPAFLVPQVPPIYLIPPVPSSIACELSSTQKIGKPLKRNRNWVIIGSLCKYVVMATEILRRSLPQNSNKVLPQFTDIHTSRHVYAVSVLVSCITCQKMRSCT